MAFQGSLAELHLPDIIQLISVSGKTGVFHLTDGPLKGEIYLNEGKIVHAQLEDATGEEAVYALAIWRQGEFRFDPGVPTDKQTISKSNTNLLMEAARRLDEWRVLSKKIPSTDLVPEFVMQETRDGQINLNTSEWLILSKIDGQRSVKGIAVASGLSVFDAAKMLYGLVAGNLIRLREPTSGPAPAIRLAPPPLAGAAPRRRRRGRPCPPTRPWWSISWPGSLASGTRAAPSSGPWARRSWPSTTCGRGVRSRRAREPRPSKRRSSRSCARRRS